MTARAALAAEKNKGGRPPVTLTADQTIALETLKVAAEHRLAGADIDNVLMRAAQYAQFVKRGGQLQ